MTEFIQAVIRLECTRGSGFHEAKEQEQEEGGGGGGGISWNLALRGFALTQLALDLLKRLYTIVKGGERVYIYIYI